MCAEKYILVPFHSTLTCLYQQTNEDIKQSTHQTSLMCYQSQVRSSIDYLGLRILPNVQANTGPIIS